jgi:hypothetical protein
MSNKLIAYSILSKCNYKIIKIYKQTQKDIVILVESNKFNKSNKSVKYVAKISLNMKTIATEIQAYTYFLNHDDFINSHFFVKLVEILPNNIGFIMEYANNAIPLIEFSNNNNLGAKWWQSLILQLLAFTNLLEKHKILHNDFWDANIMIQRYPKNRKLIVDIYDGDCDTKIVIPNEGFIIKVVDFQYTHQYMNSNSTIISPMVKSEKQCNKAEKLLLGWTSKWHTGGDLNQIFGILHEYISAPKQFIRYVAKHVYKRKTSKFPYATTRTNKWFNWKKMHYICTTIHD